MAQDVNCNFSKDADFSLFKTYAWVEMGGQKLDRLTAQQLTSAVDAELARKGLRKVDVDHADLTARLQVAIRQEQEITSYNTGLGYGAGWRAGGFSTAQTNTILVGAPVRRNGSLYADGAFMDNLPVDVVKKMGADIVIAVNLSVAPFHPENNQSLVSVPDRSIGVMITVTSLATVQSGAGIPAD